MSAFSKRKDVYEKEKGMRSGKRLLSLLLCCMLIGNVLPVNAKENVEGSNITNETTNIEEDQTLNNEEQISEEIEIKDGNDPEVTKEKEKEASDNNGADEELETEETIQENTKVTGESWLWPVKECTTISSGYGYRTHPTSGKWKLHSGIDIPAQAGTPIRATQSGYLVVKGFNQYRGYWSVIDHQNGTYSDYQHMSSYAISTNQWVNQGDIIGYVGSTGDVTGAHLHFEIRTGAVNQAGNYDSLTPVNTNKDSISYVYDIAPTPSVPDITNQTPIVAVDANGIMSTRFNAVSNVYHYDIVLFSTNNVELAFTNIGTATQGEMQLPRKGVYYVYIYAYGSTGERTISQPAQAIWVGKNINIGEDVITGIKSKNGSYLFTESVDGVLKKGSYSDNEKELNKYLYRIVKLNSNNEYAIYSKLNNKALTVESTGFQNEVGLSFKTYTGSNLQKFVFKDIGSKTNYVIAPVGSSFVLDAGNMETNKMFIYIYTSYENNNQYFSLANLKATPQPVTNLKAVPAGKNKVKLTWTASKNAEGYLVYSQKNGKYGYCTMATKQTMAIDTKALDTEYNFYWVYPYVKDGSGKRIVGKCTKYVYAKGIVPAVTNLKATSLKGSVKLTWTSSPGADGYLIYGKTASGKYGYISMTTKATSYTHKKASKAEYNFYWVYPYHNKNGKRVIGLKCNYVYGKAKR